MAPTLINYYHIINCSHLHTSLANSKNVSGSISWRWTSRSSTPWSLALVSRAASDRSSMDPWGEGAGEESGEGAWVAWRDRSRMRLVSSSISMLAAPVKPYKVYFVHAYDKHLTNAKNVMWQRGRSCETWETCSILALTLLFGSYLNWSPAVWTDAKGIDGRHSEAVRGVHLETLDQSTFINAVSSRCPAFISRAVPVHFVGQDVTIAIIFRFFPDHEHLTIRDFSHMRPTRARWMICNQEFVLLWQSMAGL